MALRLALLNACLSILFIFSFVSEARHHGHGHGHGHGHRLGPGSIQVGLTKIFNVNSYGAIADGKTDNSLVFLKAWHDACGWNGGRSEVLIPPGTYMLHSVVFQGPCKGPIVFLIRGVLKAPILPALFFIDHWIKFLYIDQLEMEGGGTLDGQGVHAWAYNDCARNHNCKSLPISVRLDFVNNAYIHNIKSIDSKNVHFNAFACDNLNMSHITITAPMSSLNTDGIHVSKSTNVRITNSAIHTGDDCIAILPGSQNVHISQITCGPGHGISVGSLGGFRGPEYDVTGLTVTNCTLSGTLNGLRIKTSGHSYPSTASNFMFDNIVMFNVHNPIIIEQQYCPFPPCFQGESQVQIRNVTYKDIRGTSTSKEAVNLKCSGKFPCQNIDLVNINLAYNGPGGPATSSCSNVYGKSYGRQTPSSCL